MSSLVAALRLPIVPWLIRKKVALFFVRIFASLSVRTRSRRTIDFQHFSSPLLRIVQIQSIYIPPPFTEVPFSLCRLTPLVACCVFFLFWYARHIPAARTPTSYLLRLDYNFPVFLSPHLPSLTFHKHRTAYFFFFCMSPSNWVVVALAVVAVAADCRRCRMFLFFFVLFVRSPCVSVHICIKCRHP